MANNIIITANWANGSLSNGMLSRQYDNNRYVVQFTNYPLGEDEDLSLYLIVWMKTEENGQSVEQAPIELDSDQWIITNYYTQFVQSIQFQLCVRNETGTFEAHSPIFNGNITKSLSHDGSTQEIYVDPLFDAYKEYVDELVVGAGAVVIDPDLDTTGAAADAKATGDAIAELQSGGYVADQQQIEAKINAWLSDHPEATTTVQDGSLTEAKFSDALKLKVINGYVTPEMFGAKGDGVTDDTQAISKTLNHGSINDCAVLFKTGRIYAVTQILITNPQSVDFCGCILKALAVEAPLKLNQTTFSILPSGDIKNVTIDMNNLATIGYHVAQWWRGNHENIAVINPPVNGTGIILDGTSAGNLFTAIKGVGNTTGKSLFIDIEAADNTFNNIDWKQFTEGIYCEKFTVFNNIHGFVVGDDLYPDSYFMKIATGIQASNLYPDTQQYALIFSDNNRPSIIENITFVFNSDAVSAEVITANVPYGIFAVENEYKNTRRVQINNVSIETTVYNANGLFNYKNIEIMVANVTCIAGCIYTQNKHMMNKNSDVSYSSAPDGSTDFPFCSDEIYTDAITAKVDLAAFTGIVSKATRSYFALKTGYYTAVTELNGVRTAVLVRVTANRQLQCLTALTAGTVLYVSIPVEQMRSA